MKLDGRQISAPLSLECDVVIVGSGPAGSVAAWELQKLGAKVVVVERGRWWDPSDFSEDGFRAMAELYDGMGATVTRGRAPIPYLQGVAVGGTSIINGAISWRLPKDIWQSWVDDDRELEKALPWEAIEEATDEVERELQIRPTPAAVKGRNDKLLAIGAERLGIEHRPIRRNTPTCVGSGRCLQGCPNGAKKTPDRTYLKWALDAGTTVLSSTTARHLRHDQSGARGIDAQTASGHAVRIDADVVVVAASAIGSPLLLLESGLHQGPVGHNFQAHPGVSVYGEFDEDVEVWNGSTQGHEVIGLRNQRLKFEALGFDVTIAATRLHGIGSPLLREVESMGRLAHWGCAVRASARGRVRTGLLGAPRVDYELSRQDRARVREGIAWLGRMMLAADANWCAPGIHGWDDRVADAARLDALASEASDDARHYSCVVTHMFGTCGMGSDPTKSVVDPSFEHHHVSGVFVLDSSAFPTNTGVNPQTSIIALAKLGARGIAAR